MVVFRAAQKACRLLVHYPEDYFYEFDPPELHCYTVLAMGKQWKVRIRWRVDQNYQPDPDQEWTVALESEGEL